MFETFASAERATGIHVKTKCFTRHLIFETLRHETFSIDFIARCNSFAPVFQANMLADANMWSGKDLGGPQEKTRSVASDSDTEAPSENAVPGEEFLSESDTEEGTMAPAGIICFDAAKDAHVDNTMEAPSWIAEPPSPLNTEPPSPLNGDGEDEDEDALAVGVDPEKGCSKMRAEDRKARREARRARRAQGMRNIIGVGRSLRARCRLCQRML